MWWFFYLHFMGKIKVLVAMFIFCGVVHSGFIHGGWGFSEDQGLFE